MPKIAGIIVCTGAAVFLAVSLHAFYPIQNWLFWQLAAIWGWALLWVAACLAVGDLAMVRLFRVTDLPRVQALVLTFTMGVVLFVIGMFLLGALGLFVPAFAVILPIACIVANAPRVTFFVGTWFHQPKPQLRLGPGALVGVLCLGIIYLGMLTPATISCDAGWFHMSAAEDYVREGKLVPLTGDWAKALPQLTTILHTWSFLLPGLGTETHWMMGLHVEFVLFLFTLLAVVATIQWLLRRDEGYGQAWSLFFLFPGIFIYDSNLGGAADHVHAFFVLPLLLAGLRAVEKPDPRMAAIAGVAAGGAFLTKVQALYVVAPMCLLLVGKALWSCMPRAKARPSSEWHLAFRNLFYFGLALLIVMAPHFIKNSVFYRNPVYPFMMDFFRASRPTMPDAGKLFYEHLAPVAVGPFWGNFTRSLGRIFSFSLTVHNPHPPQNVPFIGPLFSFLLPMALFWRDRRVLSSIFVALSALFLWAFFFPTSRNLQTFLPILVAITGALMMEIWRRGVWARAALVGLVSLQIIWSGDLAFSSTRGRITDSMALISSGIEGKSSTRFQSYFAGTRALDKNLPADAVVLLHTSYTQLGINRRTLLDWPGFQGLIDYRPMLRARDVYNRFHDLGITHITTSPPWPAHSRQEEAVFDAFLYRHTTSLGRMGDFFVWEMPTIPPPFEKPYLVVCLAIADYPDGLYRVEQLDNLDDGPRSPRTPESPCTHPSDVLPLLKKAEVVFKGLNPSIDTEGSAELERAFKAVASYPQYTVYLRSK